MYYIFCVSWCMIWSANKVLFVTDAYKRASGRFVVVVLFSVWEFYSRKLTKYHSEMETKDTKKTVSRFRICWIINRVPVSVGEPHGVSFHCISILIAVPAIVSMGSVLNIENGMTKTGLAVCWVLWLWICHTAENEATLYLTMQANWKIYIWEYEFLYSIFLLCC